MAEIRLTTLGHTDLRREDGRAILSVLAQPKRFALLVYLAVEGSTGLIRRDSVAALFWPERGQSEARANLRKSLHFLRKSLGHDVIVTRGDEELGVDPSLLQCDVVSLLTVGEVGVRGIFLDGFHFPGATAEWEGWLGNVRSRARALAPEVEEGEGELSGLQATHEPGGRENDSPIRAPVGRKRLVALAVSIPALILLIGLGQAFSRGGDPRLPVSYNRIVLGSGAQHRRVVPRHYALPPDGSGILFRDTKDQRAGSWWKAADQFTSSYMPELDDVVSPVFSPDGRWIAFARDGFLLKQTLDGAIALLLADSVSQDFSPGLAWLSDGTILFEDMNHHLRRVSEEGGASELIATMGAGGEVFQASGFPSREGALVVGCDGSCEAAAPSLFFLDFERDTLVALRSDIWMAWPMDDGHVVVVDEQGTVSASTFDPSTGVIGQPIPLLTGVRVSPFPELVMGLDGSLLFIPGGREPNVRGLVWVHRDGRADPLDPSWEPPGSVRSLSLSPDGTRLALGMRNVGDVAGEQIWIKELPDGPASPLTVGPSEGRRPVWSPDGHTIAFITQFQREDSTWHSFVSTLPADASSMDSQVLVRANDMVLEVVLANDGGHAVVRTGNAGTGQGSISIAALGTGAGLETYLATEANEYGIDLSPDGHWLAYVSEVSGRPEVYVRPFPDQGPRTQVSRNGGTEPRWAHNGTELFFRSLPPEGPTMGPIQMSVARVSTDPTFQVESIKGLFPEGPFARGNPVRLYDVTADDERFLMVAPYGSSGWSRGEVIYSRGWYWSEEIQARIRE